MQETQEMQVRSWGREDPLEEKMATHSSILAWRIPWTEEPAKLHYSAWVTESQTGLKQLSMQHVQNIYKAIQKSFAFLTIPI